MEGKSDERIQESQRHTHTIPHEQKDEGTDLPKKKWELFIIILVLAKNG